MREFGDRVFYRSTRRDSTEKKVPVAVSQGKGKEVTAESKRGDLVLTGDTCSLAFGKTRVKGGPFLHSIFGEKRNHTAVGGEGGRTDPSEGGRGCCRLWTTREDAFLGKKKRPQA